jgi:hypothetical protein
MMRIGLMTALAAVLLSTGCASVRIGRINADPSRYRNQTVRVTGTVTKSVGVMGAGGYEIEDETGKIYVISTAGVPSSGSRVTVKGTVVPGAQVLGRTFTAIRAESHKVK